MSEFLVIFFAALSVISLVATLTSYFLAVRTLVRRRPVSEFAPPLSILKPVKGLDDGLYDNLVALITQDYPDFEILVGAEDALDPALDVAREVQRQFPQAPLRILVCNEPVGANPKVNNLVTLTRQARHELVLVSDSNVRPNAGYLRETAARLEDPDVGMVFNVPCGVGEVTLGAEMENLQLNSFIASTVCSSEPLGHPCVVGKSMLFAKTDLADLGGWESVGNVLAEDYVLGRRFHCAGRKVVVCSHVLPVVNRQWKFGRFINRHLRWAQMRRRLAPITYLFEPLLNPVVWLLGLFVAAVVLPGIPVSYRHAITTACLGGVGLKIAIDALLTFCLRRRGVGWRALFVVPLKDLVIFALWAIGGARSTVQWRGNRFRIGSGSRILPTSSAKANGGVDCVGLDRVDLNQVGMEQSA